MKASIYAFAIALLIALTCTACNTEELETGQEEQPAISALASASIWGDPSVVAVPPGWLGTSRICWVTQSLSAPVWIRVRVNDGAGQLFTKESDNGYHCEYAPWIVAGNSYSFKVHTTNSDYAPYLASTTVVGVVGDPPPPPPSECGMCPYGYSCRCDDVCRPDYELCP